MNPSDPVGAHRSRQPPTNTGTASGGGSELASPLRCSLCDSRAVRTFSTLAERRYLRCGNCRLTFLAPKDRLAPDEELARYETHENDPSDPRYRRFLQRLLDPLTPLLTPASKGLDYGSGPGPTLSVMLEEKGFRMRNYDPFFAPDLEVLESTYDFITCSETAEHFFAPGEEFERLDRMLRPGGWLALMTGILEDDSGFPDWWYARDPTHVSFYRRETLEWVASRFGWDLRTPAPNVALYRKPREGGAGPPGPG